MPGAGWLIVTVGAGSLAILSTLDDEELAQVMRSNAARLLANYVMSREGNKVFNDDPGGVTIHDTSGLPKQYEAPKEGTGTQSTSQRREQLTKLLGF